VQEVRASQTSRAISQPLLINQKRKRDACFFTKEPRVTAVAKPHGSYVCALATNYLLFFAQLRDVLPAENSTVVPQENHYRRLRRPQRTQPDLFPIRIRQHNHRQPAS
jgi:hypothetical protein